MNLQKNGCFTELALQDLGEEAQQVQVLLARLMERLEVEDLDPQFQQMLGRQLEAMEEMAL